MTDNINQLKKPQDIVFWAKTDYANMIAINMRKDIAKYFGMPAEVEVGGFPGDEMRPIRVHYFGSDSEFQSMTKYISSHYNFGIDRDDQ